MSSATYAGDFVRLEITYATDTAVAGDGFRFDQVTITDFDLQVADSQPDVCAEADLSVTMADAPDPVDAGGTLSYTVEVTNNGTAEAENVVVQHFLPDGLEDLATSGCVEDLGGAGSTCSLGDLSNGTSKQYTLSGTAQVGTMVTTEVAVGSDTFDGALGNNGAQETTSVLGTGGSTLGVGGDEFVINTYTTGQQQRPAVAPSGSGFVAVWHGPAGNADDDVRGALLDADGQSMGAELALATTLTGTQSHPDIAARANGDFVVAWQSDAVINYDIVVRAFQSNGNPLGAELSPADNLFNDQVTPKIAAGPLDTFYIVWNDTSGSNDISGRLLDVDGIPLSSEMTINSTTVGIQKAPDVAAMPDGGFVVAWQDGTDGSDADIRARLVSSTGDPVATDFLVNNYLTGNQVTPAVAANNDGDFTITWSSDSPSFREIKARGFDSTGSPLDFEEQISLVTDSNGNQSEPDVTVDPFQDVYFSWRDDPSPSLLGSPIYISSRGASGPPFGTLRPGRSELGDGLGPVVTLNNLADDDVANPALAARAGTVLGVWQSDSASNLDIRGNTMLTLGTSTIFADGFESGDTSGWSSSSP